jgi:hypothetical protein
MPGKMMYAAYTSDDGNQYGLRVRRAHQAIGALGLGNFAAGLAPLPRGMEPRKVYLQDPTGGAKRAVPVGIITADAWTGLATVIPQDYSGVAGTTDFAIVGRTPERPAKLPHQIVNQSDAP